MENMFQYVTIFLSKDLKYFVTNQENKIYLLSYQREHKLFIHYS